AGHDPRSVSDSDEGVYPGTSDQRGNANAISAIQDIVFQAARCDERAARPAARSSLGRRSKRVPQTAGLRPRGRPVEKAGSGQEECPRGVPFELTHGWRWPSRSSMVWHPKLSLPATAISGFAAAVSVSAGGTVQWLRRPQRWKFNFVLH